MSDAAGGIGWHDLTVEDAPRIRDFYQVVVGWRAEPLDMGGYDDYVMVQAGTADPVAGICHARGPNATIPAAVAGLLPGGRPGLECGRVAPGAHAGRGSQDPDQRRRPLQRAPLAAAPLAVRHRSSPNTLKKMLLSWPLAEQRRFFERRSASGWRWRPRRASSSPSRTGPARCATVCSRRPRRAARRSASSATSPTFARRWRGRGLVDRARGRRGDPGSGGGPGERRTLRAGDRERRNGAAHRRPAGAYPPRHLSRADAADGGAAGARASRRRLAGGRDRGTAGQARLHGRRRVPLHAPRLQRPGGARRLAPGGALAAARRGAPAAARALDGAGRRRLGRRAARRGHGTAGSLLRRHLPARLAEALLAEAGVEPERVLAQLRREERTRLVELLTRYPLPWSGDEGYKKAEVTGGGVALGEVDPRTLESRLHPRLFLCGEILDAFGPIGGYNFAWGWATGRCTATSSARCPWRR
jgi:hypothetical protein